MGGHDTPTSPGQHSPPMRDPSPPPAAPGEMSPHPHMAHTPPVSMSQWPSSHLPPNMQQDIKPPPMMPLTPTSQMPMGYPGNYSWYQSDANMNQHQGLLT